MVRLARAVGAVVALLSGVLAGWVLWSPLGSDARDATSNLPAILAADGAGVACAAVIAVAVTSALARRRSIALTTVVGAAGPMLLALPELIRYPADSAVFMYSNAVAAGLVLGAAAPLASRQLSAQASLAAGMIGAFMLAEAVEGQRYWSEARGWTAYASLTEWDPGAVLPSWIPITTAVLVIVGSLLDRRTSWTTRLDRRLLLLVAALPVVAFAVNWLLVDGGAPPTAWFVYAAVVVAVVAWSAWRLPGPDGRILFAGTAVLAAALGGAPSSTTEPWILAISAALIAAGTALGLRFPMPMLGFGLLALVAAAVLLTQEPWDAVPVVGFIFVLPAAAAFVVSSCLPTSAPASTVGLSLPFTIAIPAAVSAAWVTGSRYGDYAPAPLFHWPEAVPTGAAVVSVAVVVVCGVGAWGLDLRSGLR
ncbi:hypothetical protein [Rhodococcus spongiicola]|uniref:Uncharacterized protein n=1 Tax=Rhodococcus spongiicola TaxID=2487352 RepID=A0A438B5C5_9NOCA|nr:hypothetical protein [Rhodococcus spongiicola]RVW05938.1 hypothetical protein EF834_00140 [Rhodococcus spongiicola]